MMVPGCAKADELTVTSNVHWAEFELASIIVKVTVCTVPAPESIVDGVGDCDMFGLPSQLSPMVAEPV